MKCIWTKAQSRPLRKVISQLWNCSTQDRVPSTHRTWILLLINIKVQFGKDIGWVWHHCLCKNQTEAAGFFKFCACGIQFTLRTWCTGGSFNFPSVHCGRGDHTCGKREPATHISLLHCVGGPRPNWYTFKKDFKCFIQKFNYKY